MILKNKCSFINRKEKNDLRSINTNMSTLTRHFVIVKVDIKDLYWFNITTNVN